MLGAPSLRQRAPRRVTETEREKQWYKRRAALGHPKSEASRWLVRRLQAIEDGEVYVHRPLMQHEVECVLEVN